ncbi:hypothetical protein BCR44DRAFT_40810 [Catenaria anguillulae PL171]|uniref:Uncharacterized protein n=1 Tax=Catenaria anguillulae PL171 TaxID=765915 RepID=A0A1Y2HNG7_9FUNG|nr:hypothetical protein BCR44DRAFT_40810 [Catenaria anguillulae PL171]
MAPRSLRQTAMPSATSNTAGLQTPPGTTAPSLSASSSSSASPDPSPDPQTPTPSSSHNQTDRSAIRGDAAGDGSAADAPPDPYTSTDPITLESANFDPNGSNAIQLNVKTQVRFYYKERPNQKKFTTKDPQKAMIRPIMPSNILFKFNIGPQKTLDDFKGLVMEAIGPALGGAATRAQPSEPSQATEQSGDATPPPATTAAQSPTTPPQPKLKVTPASLHSQKRFYFLWGEEPESHQNNHIKLTVDNLSALATANESILLVIFRFGFACLKLGVEGVVNHRSNGVLALDFGQDADHGVRAIVGRLDGIAEGFEQNWRFSWVYWRLSLTDIHDVMLRLACVRLGWRALGMHATSIFARTGNIRAAGEAIAAS